MADNTENPLGNFSIEDTMEMGLGNRELLTDLFAPDSATGNPGDIETLEESKKKEDAKKAKLEAEKVKKEATKKEKLKTGSEEEEEEKDDSLKTFLEDDETPEVKKKVEKKEEGEQEEETIDESKEENRFSALSKDLFKLGVFSKEEGEEEVDISTPEAFLERFHQEKQKGSLELIDKFIGQFGEDYQQAFDAIFVKGVDPKEYFGSYNSIKDFSALDLKLESNQAAVVQQVLLDQGFEPEDVTTELERLKNNGDLENVAQKHHKVLIKKEAAKLAQLEKDSSEKLKQQKAQREQYSRNVTTVLQNKLKTSEFDGIPINPKLAQELQDFLITDKYKLPSGETLTEFDRTILDLKRPENHEKKVKIALLIKLLEKDPTLTTIQKAGLSKKSDALFGELARQTGKSSTKTEKTTTKPTSWFTS